MLHCVHLKDMGWNMNVTIIRKTSKSILLTATFVAVMFGIIYVLNHASGSRKAEPFTIEGVSWSLSDPSGTCQATELLVEDLVINRNRIRFKAAMTNEDELLEFTINSRVYRSQAIGFQPYVAERTQSNRNIRILEFQISTDDSLYLNKFNNTVYQGKPALMRLLLADDEHVHLYETDNKAIYDAFNPDSFESSSLAPLESDSPSYYVFPRPNRIVVDYYQFQENMNVSDQLYSDIMALIERSMFTYKKQYAFVTPESGDEDMRDRSATKTITLDYSDMRNVSFSILNDDLGTYADYQFDKLQFSLNSLYAMTFLGFDDEKSFLIGPAIYLDEVVDLIADDSIVHQTD